MTENNVPKPDGGPAFARPIGEAAEGNVTFEQDGMSFRDYVATSVAGYMYDLMRNMEWDILNGMGYRNAETATAGESYELAQAFVDEKLKRDLGE